MDERRSGTSIDPPSKSLMKRKSASTRREESVEMFSFNPL